MCLCDFVANDILNILQIDTISGAPASAAASDHTRPIAFQRVRSSPMPRSSSIINTETAGGGTFRRRRVSRSRNSGRNEGILTSASGALAPVPFRRSRSAGTAVSLSTLRSHLMHRNRSRSRSSRRSRSRDVGGIQAGASTSSGANGSNSFNAGTTNTTSNNESQNTS